MSNLLIQDTGSSGNTRLSRAINFGKRGATTPAEKAVVSW